MSENRDVERAIVRLIRWLPRTTGRTSDSFGHFCLRTVAEILNVDTNRVLIGIFRLIRVAKASTVLQAPPRTASRERSIPSTYAGGNAAWISHWAVTRTCAHVPVSPGNASDASQARTRYLSKTPASVRTRCRRRSPGVQKWFRTQYLKLAWS